ncbi:MAG: right-handed parallel beta-helix repeat-containing protein [Planctomycetota bacterium]
MVRSNWLTLLIISMLFLFILTSCMPAKKTTNPKPSASFYFSPASGCAPLIVQFIDTSTGNPNTWQWSFGDGSSSNAQNQSHTYTEPGIYSVSLKVTNSGGTNTCNKENCITVTNASVTLTAGFSVSPETGEAPLTVQFTDESIPVEAITSWMWDFGDEQTSTEQNPEHTYTNVGTYTVTLTVEGQNASPDTESKQIYVLDVPAELHVPSAYPTIQSAIDASVDGQVVLVANGTFTGQGNTNLDFYGKAITVRAENGAENCIIDCQNTDDVRGFNFHSGETGASVVDGFTIRGGNVWNGNGGAVLCTGASPVITNCTLEDNSAPYGGGIYCGSCPNMEITNCTIRGNSVGIGDGGGILSTDSSITISNCTIENNVSDSGFGAGIGCESNSTVHVENCTIQNNTGFTGGGISLDNSSITILDSTISDNTGLNGSGIYCQENSEFTVINCEISGNAAELNGGGLYSIYSSGTIDGCTFSDNSAHLGGGISCDVDSDVTITHTTVTDNNVIYGTAGGSGGGILCSHSNPTIISCIITDNIAYSGAGISCVDNSFPIITNCLIAYNRSTLGTAYGLGAGIACFYSANPTINNCTIVNNVANQSGGGITPSSPVKGVN